MPRLLLVDGHSNLYRAFYAIRGLTAPDGTPTNAAYGFLRMLHKLVRELEPSHLGVAFDVGRETFRSRMDERYKAQRAPMPEDLAVQIPHVQQALRLMGVPVLAVEDVEADDVIGTLAARAADAGLEVVIATSDKDLMQLVRDPAVKLFHTRHERLLDEAGVEETFGVPPGRVVEILALMGDSSDNVPGCKGIGEKGALQLIARWGSVATLYEHLGDVTPARAQKALAEHRAEVELSRELVTIHTSVPLELDLDDLARGGGDAAALADLYRRLGFTSLVAELEGAGEAARPPVASVRDGTLKDLAHLLESAPTAAVAATPQTIAVATDGEVISASSRSDDFAELLIPRLDRLWCYDAKALLSLLGGAEIRGDAVGRDAMLGAYLLAPGEKVDLPVLCQRFRVPPPAMATPAEEAVAVMRLSRPIAEGLNREGLDSIFRDVELALVPVLEAMERRGVLLDVDALADLSRRLERSLAELEGEIHSEAGGAFNVNSPQQLAEVIFTRRGLPVLRRTAKTRAPSTDADVLQELAARGHRLPALILDYREQAKLKSTYVDALPRQVAADGRVHTRFNQAVAATGRLSSSDPNLQNIPIRTELGREVRRAFVSPPGSVLLAADYSQIELRVLAHLSGDPGLEEAFLAGDDIHRATASRVFDVAPELVSSEQRRAAKTINFGLIYGMGAFALGRELGVPQKEAQRFINAYFARFPRVLDYMEETRARARETGKVTTMLGRIRWISGLDSANAGVRGNAERMAMNAPIQGSAADLMKLAMIKLFHRLRRERSSAHILLQVHDELVLEVGEGEAETAMAVVREEMEGVAQLRVPLKVDVAVARSWADAKG